MALPVRLVAAGRHGRGAVVPLETPIGVGQSDQSLVGLPLALQAPGF